MHLTNRPRTHSRVAPVSYNSQELGSWPRSSVSPGLILNSPSPVVSRIWAVYPCPGAAKQIPFGRQLVDRVRWRVDPRLPPGEGGGSASVDWACVPALPGGALK